MRCEYQLISIVLEMQQWLLQNAAYMRRRGVVLEMCGGKLREDVVGQVGIVLTVIG
jgi:hypothetical protein